MTDKGLGRGGNIPRIKTRKSMYRKVAVHFDEILEELLKLLHNGNPSVRTGAVKILINKILPDLKATELSAKDGKSLEGLITIKYEGNNSEPVANDSSPGQSSI